MAFARTATYTATYTRVELIKLQVQRVLARSIPDQRGYINKLLRGIDKRYISEISVYGLDRDEMCRAELFIEIDWKRNALHISAGREKVQVDSRWQEGIAVEVDLTLQKFEEVTRELGLHKIVYCRYGPGVNREKANRELGLQPADPVRWKSGFVGTKMSIPELDEFSIGINIAGDD